MNFKGMPIYGVGNRPYEDLEDDELATKRQAALDDGKDMPLIIALNTETQLRKMIEGGAKLMRTPKYR